MLKLQYSDHLMWTGDSLEKTLMLEKIEGRKRRWWQRMKWLDSKLWKIVKDRGAWCTAVHGVAISWTCSVHASLHKHATPAAAAAKSLQSCPTLCDPIDGSPPGWILQARTLEWVAISFSNAWKWKVKVKLLSHVRLLETPGTAAYQAPPSMGFARQEYWSGLPLPSPVSKRTRIYT